MPEQDIAARLRVVVRGVVQGVGFRPYVYRLATELGLTGWVSNSAQGVHIEAEGARERLERFLLRLESEKPAPAVIQGLEATWLDPVGLTMFEIRASDPTGAKTTRVLPDLAVCADCLAELFDPKNRRYRYPFINCTQCGPRYSILESLPYDRPNTTMKSFVMCDRCLLEYMDPLDRRFHAQPNACSECGPHLELWNAGGDVLACHDGALRETAEAIRRGEVVAVKGLGGFHLMVDARHEAAVRRLRKRKRREEKPLALMLASLDAVEALCEVSPFEARLLRSPESPIVLLKRRTDVRADSRSIIAPSVAPGSPNLGVMLPYAPLHHLLMAELGFPVVATSGNLSDEPICIDEREALTRLADIADLFLVHNRPIARHVDDSVARVLLGREQILRRARGYAPLPIDLTLPAPSSVDANEPEKEDEGRCVLAVGAHLKNTVALSIGNQAFVSQHVGDLETPQAFDAFCRALSDLQRLYDRQPTFVACDLHPDYLSTQFAQRMGRRLVPVQHHYAHVLACMAENGLDGPALGVSWDGTGLGTDGTIWGGEFLMVDARGFTRFAHLRPFRLPGGEKAVKEPRRCAVGLLHALWGEELFEDGRTGAGPRANAAVLHSFSPAERGILCRMLQRGLNAPLTSSAGRLFDAVAALTGRRQTVRFEGQAAMEMEHALDGVETEERYHFVVVPGGGSWRDSPALSGSWRDSPALWQRSAAVVDWGPMIEELLADSRAGAPVGLISARFHNTLAEMIVAVAERAQRERIVLTGGCFQNRYLTERAVCRLRAAGFRPYWHQRVPPNDGGIAVGQAAFAATVLKSQEQQPCVWRYRDRS